MENIKSSTQAFEIKGAKNGYTLIEKPGLLQNLRSYTLCSDCENAFVSFGSLMVKIPAFHTED
jgi:hypothetical protein